MFLINVLDIVAFPVTACVCEVSGSSCHLLRKLDIISLKERLEIRQASLLVALVSASVIFVHESYPYLIFCLSPNKKIPPLSVKINWGQELASLPTALAKQKQFLSLEQHIPNKDSFYLPE